MLKIEQKRLELEEKRLRLEMTRLKLTLAIKYIKLVAANALPV